MAVSSGTWEEGGEVTYGVTVAACVRLGLAESPPGPGGSDSESGLACNFSHLQKYKLMMNATFLVEPSWA